MFRIGTYGTYFRAEISTSLNAGSWMPVLGTDPNLNNGSPLQYTLPNNLPRVFTRIVVNSP